MEQTVTWYRIETYYEDNEITEVEIEDFDDHTITDHEIGLKSPRINFQRGIFQTKEEAIEWKAELIKKEMAGHRKRIISLNAILLILQESLLQIRGS